MKKIVIAGKGSYIGNHIKHYLEDTADTYAIEELDTLHFDDQAYSFDGVDAVVCVAGIAHIKETAENRHWYYEVNRDLVVRLAKKAKADGVRQFVFLSSMSVYGKDSGVITPQTAPAPKSGYGDSKLQAEQQLDELQSDTFKIAVLRPPMVYGKDCKGNFQTVVKIVEKLPVFPQIRNQRSMVYIDNLCEFIKRCIDEERNGLYFPQNKAYVQTSAMAKIIAKEKHKKVFFSRILGFGVWCIRPFISMANKAFGSLIYEGTEQDDFSYCVVDEADSFKQSL